MFQKYRTYSKLDLKIDTAEEIYNSILRCNDNTLSAEFISDLNFFIDGQYQNGCSKIYVQKNFLYQVLDILKVENIAIKNELLKDYGKNVV